MTMTNVTLDVALTHVLVTLSPCRIAVSRSVWTESGHLKHAEDMPQARTCRLAYGFWLLMEVVNSASPNALDSPGFCVNIMICGPGHDYTAKATNQCL